jgi:hypothetical protein
VSSPTKTVWLAYCGNCKKYRTGSQASAPNEWTEDKNQAQLFGSSGHALNSARYYAPTEDGLRRVAECRTQAEALPVIVLEAEVAAHFIKRTIIEKGVSLSHLPSGELEN